jgi:hypothetical protein
MWFNMRGTLYRSCAAGFLDGTGFLGTLVGNAFEPPGKLAKVECQRAAKLIRFGAAKLIR